MKVRRRKKGETREETRTTERKRKNVTLAYLAEHRISIFIEGNLILHVLVLRFETRNFVLRVQLQE